MHYIHWPSVIPLRFSKSGNPEVEKSYATHFVDPKRIAELKAEKSHDCQQVIPSENPTSPDN